MTEAEATIREALASVPAVLAQRLGPVVFDLQASEEEVASRWQWTAAGLHVELNPNETTPHDCALELLTCMGQALWNSASAEERRTWLQLLGEEIEAKVEGEIDERALHEKRAMLSSRILAASARRMERYAETSFAGTVAEYVHSLWHEVTVQTGCDFLRLPWLHRRFALFSRWFPAERTAMPSLFRHHCAHFRRNRSS